MGETDDTLCAQAGAECGPLSTTDRCGNPRSIADCSPGCTLPQVCGGAGAPNLCSQPLDGGFVWQVPATGGNTLLAVWPFANDDVWAAGSHGALVHWDGQAITQVTGPVSYDLQALWGSGPADLWAVGASGTFLHFDGGAWAQVDAGTTSDYGDLWGSGPNNIWATGGDELRHYNGTTWSNGPAPSGLGSNFSLNSITGSGPSDIWASGFDNSGNSIELQHYNGLTWSNYSFSSSEGELYDLFALGPSDVWGVGWQSTFSSSSVNPLAEHLTDAGWHDATGTGWGYDTASRIWASSDSEVWAARSDYGRTYRLENGGWTSHDPGFHSYAVGGFAPGQVWVAGEQGQLAALEPDGGFQTVTEPKVGSCLAIASGGGAVWAACKDLLVIWDGNAWSRTAPAGLATNEYLRGTWGTDASHIWAVTDAGQILRWDGAWHQEANYAGSSLRSIWGSSTGDIWVGTTGAFAHYDGQGWSAVSLADPSEEVVSIWGTSATDVWAVTYDLVLHNDGTGWITFPVAPTSYPYPDYYGVSGTSPSDVWLVGYQFLGSGGGNAVGTAFHWDGQAWHMTVAMPSDAPSAVWAAGPHDVFVLGLNSELSHWNGLAWTQLGRAAPGTGNALVGTGPRDLFIAGEGVVRYH